MDNPLSAGPPASVYPTAASGPSSVASESSYRRLFEAAKDGILILEADTGRISDVNPFLLQMLGYSHSELVGIPVWELGPFRDIMASQEKFLELQQHGYVRYEDLPLETREGRTIAVEFVSNVYQAGDQLVIQCNIRDITERKRTEEKLRASFKEISDLKSALDEHAIVIVTDPEGRITYVNDKFCAISKFSREELLGQDHRLFSSGHHSKEFIRNLWRTIKQGHAWRGEMKNKARDNSFYWVDTTIVPFLDDRGNPSRFVVIRTDITERKVAEEHIFQLNADLEQRVADRTAELSAANQELQAFSHSVSHDLRSPLRHVLGFINLLQKDAGPSLTPTNLRHLATISKAAQRMGTLIDDLLAFSRLGRSEMQKTAVSLDQLVQETLKELQEDTNGRNISWEIQPLPTVQADRALVRMVLVNLMANAVKFTSKRLHARIEIGCLAQRKDETGFFIRDNGAGFDPQYIGKLFGVFQRLHSRNEFEGTGIGLANVQRIIQRHGGRVWAEGVMDGGATFYISLPSQPIGL